MFAGCRGSNALGVRKPKSPRPKGSEVRVSEAHQILGFGDPSEQWLVDSGCLRPW